MKIKKLTEAKKLIEAEDEEIDLTDVNPQEITTGELKDIIKDEVEEVTDGEQEISDTDALKVANEVKNTSAEVGAEQIVIGAEDYEDSKVENRLTAALDDSYAVAAKFFRKGRRGTGANVLVEGLPGSGKTAIVESWCNSRGLTLVPVNATDSKLETSINGMPLRDVTAPDENKVARVRDDVLDKLLNNLHPELAGKCILFVDEFNRQKQDQLRRPLMSLFNEKRNSDGTVDVSKNLLFSVICINPSGIKFKDKGTVDPNDAEHNRFLQTLRGFDSNAEDSLKFYKGWHIKELLDLGIIPPDSVASKNHGGFVGPTRPLSEEELEDAKEYIRIYALAKQILEHEEFKFSDRDELDELDQGLGLRKQLLTARLLTDLLNAAGGEVKKFLRLVDTTSDLLQTKIDMFHDILDYYIMDTKALYAKYNLEGTVDPKDATADVEAEDDDELFGSSSGNSSTQAFNGADAEQEVRNIIDKFF